MKTLFAAVSAACLMLAAPLAIAANAPSDPEIAHIPTAPA